MASVVLTGDTSGSITVAAPAIAGTNTLTLPALTQTLNVMGPAFNVSNDGSTQTLTANVNTKVIFGTKNFDTANCFDNVTNYRFTPNVAGYYQLNWTAGGRFATTQGNIQTYVQKNGASGNANIIYGTYLALTFTANTIQLSTGSTVLYLNGTTDYVEVYLLMNGTGTFTITGAASFSGCLLRGA